MDRVGEIAALGTALCWTASALFFERASKRIGVLAVNFYKLVFATIFLAAVAWISRGTPLPLDAPPGSWLFLSLSGLVGFVITDIFLFSAYVLVGSRVTMLFMAASPSVTAILGYLFLNEDIGAKGVLGLSVSAVGIAIATLAKGDARKAAKDGERTSVPTSTSKGYLFATLAMLGQSAGTILTKIGLGSYSAVAGTQMRVLVGLAGFAIVSLVWEKGRNLKLAVSNRAGMGLTFGGSIFGPFLGVTLSLFAVQQTKTGIASAIMGLNPVIIIIPLVVFFKQKVRLVEVIGAVVAVAGTMILFL